MNILIISIQVLLFMSLLLFLGVLVASFMKFLKKNYFPTWKFPDYISVGYAEYLVNKYIKKPLAQMKAARQS